MKTENWTEKRPLNSEIWNSKLRLADYSGDIKERVFRNSPFIRTESNFGNPSSR